MSGSTRGDEAMPRRLLYRLILRAMNNHGRWPWLIWSDLSIREHSGFFLSPGIPKL